MTLITDVFTCKAPKVYKSKVLPVECSNPELIVGLEIETEQCPRLKEWYEESISKLWMTETDGSLRGSAFEFISKPAPIKILIPELREFYRITGFKEENYTDRCSVHVHTNITDMTVQQVGVLFLVYTVFEETLFKFVNFHGIADPRGKYRDTNIYCVPWNQCRYNYDVVTKMFNDAEYTFRNWQKYTALNILPARTLGTVEWRHMHGTADIGKLEIWLNLIGSIMKFARENEFDEVVKTIKQLNDNSAYQQFYTAVLGNALPFNPDQTQAIEAGVVHAKYCLMNMKDSTVKVKPKLNTTKPAAEGLAVGLVWDVENMADEVAMEAPPEAAPAARDPFAAFRQGHLEAAQRAAPRPAGNRIRVQEEIRVAQQRRADAARRLLLGLVFPLQRGLIRGPNLLVQWGIRDAVGNLRYWTGGITPVGATFEVRAEEAQAQPLYVRGFNDDFWADTVTDNWRPEHEAEVL
jgi:hypothetical protein